MSRPTLFQMQRGNRPAADPITHAEGIRFVRDCALIAGVMLAAILMIGLGS